MSPSMTVSRKTPNRDCQRQGLAVSRVQQLSWTEDMMLRAERPETPMQIQMLLIYDPSTAPGDKVTFTGILAELEARCISRPPSGGD